MKKYDLLLFMMTSVPLSLLAQSSANDTSPSDWSFHFQQTIITQYHSDFSVKYSGQNSLDTSEPAQTSVAEREGISVPKKLSAKNAMEKARLEKLSGEAFDKAYMENQLQDHKHVIAEFQQESQDGRNSSVKEFASQTLPILQGHLQDAEYVAPKVDASTSSSAAR